MTASRQYVDEFRNSKVTSSAVESVDLVSLVLEINKTIDAVNHHLAPRRELPGRAGRLARKLPQDMHDFILEVFSKARIRFGGQLNALVRKLDEQKNALQALIGQDRQGVK
jgi:hypothetical protein